MIRRCTDPKNKAWPRYGGRGITVCDRWRNSFDAFISDLGERPGVFHLDRIDPGGNYEPGNVRWTSDSDASTKSAAIRNRGIVTEYREYLMDAVDHKKAVRLLAAKYGITANAVRSLVWRHGGSPSG
jgi:hypothetical protein